MTRISSRKRDVAPMKAQSSFLLSFCLALCACSGDTDLAETNSRLQAGTEVPVKILQMITSSDSRWQKGSKFDLVTTRDIKLGDRIIIPEGGKGVGSIICITNERVSDNSGMIVIELEHLKAGKRRVPIHGTYVQWGHGLTLGYIGRSCDGDAGFASGKSAVIPAGRELTAELEAELVL